VCVLVIIIIFPVHMCTVGCVQAVDSSVEPVTSCVELYGAVYVRETLQVIERVKKDVGMVSLKQ